MAAYVTAFKASGAIHAACEDYRAAATIDLEHDRADDLISHRLAVPMLVLWGGQGTVGRQFDVLSCRRENRMTGRRQSYRLRTLPARRSAGRNACGVPAVLLANGLRTVHLLVRFSRERYADLVAVWLKSHADGSPHTLRAYQRIGRRFVAALAAARTDLRHATVDHVQAAPEAMRVKETGSPARAATINTQVAAVKALLGFAHKVGFTRFNAAPLIKLKKAPRQFANAS